MSDSSDLPSIVGALQFGDYIALVSTTAIVYDYIITFPREINHIWNRPWTLVSILFMIVRYVGLIVGLWKYFHTRPHVGTIVLLVDVWLFVVFLAATEMMMILRVYAMYNQSKIVLALLLFLYTVTVITYAVSAGYYNNPTTYLTVTVAQILDMFVCYPVYDPPSMKLGLYKTIPRFTLSGLMFLLAVTRLGMDSFQTYNVTRQIKVNRYVALLVREGVFYFFVHVVYNVNFGSSVAGTIVNMVTFILFFILSPRFIMNVREMHLRNVLRVGRHSLGIDSGFGLSKGFSASRVLAASSVGFADSIAVQHSEDEMEMETMQ